MFGLCGRATHPIPIFETTGIAFKAKTQFSQLEISRSLSEPVAFPASRYENVQSRKKAKN